MKSWVLLALLSALFAAGVGVAGKRGADAVDPTLATAIRAVIMAVVLAAIVLGLGKQRGLSGVSRDALGWIGVSAVCGAASWICYFLALRTGPAGGVVAVDRLSVAFALVLAALFLHERLTPVSALGGALMVAGAVCIAWSR